MIPENGLTDAAAQRTHRQRRQQIAWWATALLPAPLGFGIQRFLVLIFVIFFIAQIGVAIARARLRAVSLSGVVGWFFLYWLGGAAVASAVAFLLLITHTANLTF